MQERVDARSRWLTVRGFPRLFMIGLVIFSVGGFGDLAYHLLPQALVSAFEPLLGIEAVHAHLVTLVGMAVIFIAVLRRGLSHGR